MNMIVMVSINIPKNNFFPMVNGTFCCKSGLGWFCYIKKNEFEIFFWRIARQQRVGYNSKPYSHDVSYFKLNETSITSTSNDHHDSQQKQRPVPINPVNGRFVFVDFFFAFFSNFFFFFWIVDNY